MYCKYDEYDEHVFLYWERLAELYYLYHTDAPLTPFLMNCVLPIMQREMKFAACQTVIPFHTPAG